MDLTPDILFPNLGITLNAVNRVAFSIFGLEIYWYAILVVLGIALGVYFGAFFAPKRTGQDHNLYVDFAFFVIPACIIGARLFYIIFNPATLRGNILNIFNFRDGGLAIFGVIIAAVLVSIWWCRRKKLNWFLFADTGIVGLIIGHTVGRFGNFLNREAFGGYTDGLFAMQIRADQVLNQGTITEEMIENAVFINDIAYIQVHPTFLYEAIILFSLFIFLNIYRKHKKFNGELMGYYFLVYGIARFFIEGLRTDQLMMAIIPVSQALAAIIALAGAVFLAKNYIKLKKKG